MLMLKINLLDWRAEVRERRKKQFLTIFGAALGATALGLLLAKLAVGNAIDNQNERNERLRTEIAAVEKQIKEIEELEKVRQNLIARMQVVEKLQQSRSEIVHYFDEIVSTAPDGIYLTGIKQVDTRTTLEGVAESNGRVSTYMKNLDASPWFDDPKLIVIKTREAGRRRLSDFTLEVAQVNPNAPATNPDGTPVAQQ
jgi:type IV pilus assembly protein PilN